jgi:hypothetical protein
LNKSRTWQLNLNYGLNNISIEEYTSERIHYEPGAIVCFWSNDDGFISLDAYDPNLKITDYYDETNSLVPLIPGSIRKFSVQVTTEMFSKNLIITANANKKVYYNPGLYMINTIVTYLDSIFVGPKLNVTIIDGNPKFNFDA